MSFLLYSDLQKVFPVDSETKNGKLYEKRNNNKSNEVPEYLMDMYYEEAINETSIFEGKKWPDVTPIDFSNGDGVFAWFTPECFFYYTPALVKTTDEDHELVANAVFNYCQIISGVNCDLIKNYTTWINERLSFFNKIQIQLLSDWMAYLSAGDKFDEQIKILSKNADKNLSERIMQAVK